MPTNKNRRFLRRVTPTCTIFIEVQADHGGKKITSCEILPAIVCYSSPEAKYGSLAVRNGNCRIWWKRFYMEPRSTRCKRFMSEWKRSRNVCHRSREAKTWAERPFGMTPGQKCGIDPKHPNSVEKVIHDTHTWNHVQPGAIGSCRNGNGRQTCAIGHGMRKHRPNDHSV